MLSENPVYRALTLFRHEPPACEAHPVHNESFAPHVKACEFVVIDTTDREPAVGEIFLKLLREYPTPSGFDLSQSQPLCNRLGAPQTWSDSRGRGKAMSIVIQAQTPGDSRTMFRVLVNDKLVAENLTSVQAHLIVGDALERIVLPRAA